MQQRDHELALASIAEVVRTGLRRGPRSLPPWLFYDDPGSALFEAITELPEYYLTRVERSIFAARGAAIMAAAGHGADATVIELGAGTARKTELLLAAGRTRRYVPVDVAPEPLALAQARLAVTLPALVVTPWVATHEAAFPHLPSLPGPRVALFIGSSIGNYEPAEARALLRGLRGGLAAGDALVLGVDLVKDAATLVAAYDDAAGVTAAFNRNLLTRLNRELGADFELSRFRHVALWNAARSRIEMHLESLVAQRVNLPGCDLTIDLAAGERIHTESSMKYTPAAVDDLVRAAGFTVDVDFTDPEARFAVVVCTAREPSPA
ncbi:MAG: L-histidine N(alpha)-methyltransferase [Myxococcales bacterium]|nr:L-histidine N(alpha)-methyltransferase [Myxococcales bacterium]